MNLSFNPPLVSVVIPAYNASTFIEKTLESVRAQTFNDFEIIVVDDGSQDNTKEIVDQWFERFNISGLCIRQANKKIAGARNTGMRSASGKYIALLDHDDLWTSDKLEMVMAEFSAHSQVDFIYHRLNIDRNGIIVSMTRGGPVVKKMYERLLFQGNVISPSASVFKLEKAHLIGGFRENIEFNTVEDYDFWLRFSRIAFFHFLNKVLGTYKLVDSSASRRVFYHHTNLENLLKDHFKNYCGSAPRLKTRIMIRRRFADVYRAALIQLLKYREHPEEQWKYGIKLFKTYPFRMKNSIVIVYWLFMSFIRVIRLNRK